jgi:hypothetical protein
MNELPPNLRARILAEARQVPSPTLAERRSRVTLATALAVAVSFLFLYSFGVAVKRPASVLAAVGFGCGLSAFVATWVGARRGKSMLGRPLGGLAAVAVLVPLALLGWTTMMAGVDGTIVLIGGTARQHVICAIFTVLFALGPFAALAYVRRSSDPVHPRALGAAIGAAAGAWAGAMINVHCGLTTVEHLAVAHALPIALVSLIGALTGGRVFGVRAPRER